MGGHMQFIPSEIPGVMVIEPTILRDDRGYFLEVFNKEVFDRHVPGVSFVQDNESMSVFGVLRGLHYQVPPFAQGKLVSVVVGRVRDVAVDIRKGSPTFGHHAAVELSAENRRQFFIPRGFAHGFVVLSQVAVFQYKVDNHYSREHDRGILFSDPALGIDWGLGEDELVLSEKDRANPLLRDAELFAYGGDNA